MARPKLGDSDTARLHIKITADEIEAIEDWRFPNRVPSRSEAVRRLIQIGLRFEDALPKIGNAGDGLAKAADAVLHDFYLSAEREQGLSVEARNALRAMRKVMRKAHELVEQLASVDIQREVLVDASKTFEDALAAADETLKLFSPLPTKEDGGEK